MPRRTTGDIRHRKIVRTDQLSAVMEFDHVIEVYPDGMVGDGPSGYYAPNLLDDELDDSSWTLMNGYSGQDRYRGPIMHNSEFIGGRMANDMLETPGLYVAIAAYWTLKESTCRHCDRQIVLSEEGKWIDPEAPATPEDGDDYIWRETCDSNDTFEALHEPSDEDPDIEGWAIAYKEAPPHPDALPCGCIPHDTRMTGMGFTCDTEQQGYCNFECPHQED